MFGGEASVHSSGSSESQFHWDEFEQKYVFLSGRLCQNLELIQVKLVMIAGNGEQTAAHELDLVKLMYMAHERQCQDHVRYQEHQDKPDNQFAVSPGSVHILLTDFSTAASDPGHTALQSIPRRSGCRLI